MHLPRPTLPLAVAVLALAPAAQARTVTVPLRSVTTPPVKVGTVRADVTRTRRRLAVSAPRVTIKPLQGGSFDVRTMLSLTCAKGAARRVVSGFGERSIELTGGRRRVFTARAASARCPVGFRITAAKAFVGLEDRLGDATIFPYKARLA